MTRFLLFAGNTFQSSHGYVGAFDDRQTAIDFYFQYVNACEYEWGRIYEVPDRGDAFIVWSAQTGPLKLDYTAPAEAQGNAQSDADVKKQLNDTAVKLELANIGRRNAEHEARAQRAEVQKLHERIEAHERVNQVANNEVLRYRDLCTQHEQQIEQLKIRAQELEQRLTAAHDRVSRLTDLHDAATKVQQNLFESIDRYKSQHRAEIEQWQNKLRLETDLRMEAEQKLKAAQQTIETQQLEPEAQQIEWLYKQLSKEQNELSVAREKNAELLTVNSSLRVKVRKLESCEAAIRSIAETAQKELREITDENVTGK